MKKHSPSLEVAYSLKSSDDNVKLYSAWANDYDKDFAEKMDYTLPKEVVAHFVNHGGVGPVIDVGAGTGLAGEALSDFQIEPIDALDLSSDMLKIAQDKLVYRKFIIADIKKPFKAKEGYYSGVISSGTFTHGHVGPDALENLLLLAAPNALFSISINKKYWKEKGFRKKFDSLKGSIDMISLEEVALYGPNSQGEHRNDLGCIAVFRKK